MMLSVLRNKPLSAVCRMTKRGICFFLLAAPTQLRDSPYKFAGRPLRGKRAGAYGQSKAEHASDVLVF
jgi:hypothetical protein